MIHFSVDGKPATAGSKRGILIPRKGKKPFIAMKDMSGDNGRAWRALVQDRARQAMTIPLEGALVLLCSFRQPRPKKHYLTSGLRPDAPEAPDTPPDATKLVRAIEDALNGVLWIDDSRIVLQVIRKVYAETFGADICVGHLGEREVHEEASKWAAARP